MNHQKLGGCYSETEMHKCKIRTLLFFNKFDFIAKDFCHQICFFE